jgi:hypothetical protein
MTSNVKKNWLFAFAVVAISLVGMVIFLPTQVSISRTIDIKADKSLVYAQMVNFQNFENWSPWSNLDSNLVTRLEGQAGEVGSKYIWKGNDKVGSGEQEILSLNDSMINIMVRFSEPWVSESPSYYKVLDKSGQTSVEWGMSSFMPRPFNVLAFFLDIKSSIAKDFDKGLIKLKARCESVSDTVSNL